MFKKLLALSAIAFVFPAHAALVDAGDLTIINDSGNPSDGLRYLDMFYSDGLTQADALSNAQSTYANARLATPSEWDDLFDASDIVYDPGRTASDAFSAGINAYISSGANYDSGVLAGLLGPTDGTWTFFWSSPDGTDSPTSGRDMMLLSEGSAIVYNYTHTPEQSWAGWLLVSNPAPVPVPAAGWLFMSALLGLAGKNRLSRR